MSSDVVSCPKCGASMEPGFILDKAHYGMPTVKAETEGKNGPEAPSRYTLRDAPSAEAKKPENEIS
jgi:hypothetical protein